MKTEIHLKRRLTKYEQRFIFNMLLGNKNTKLTESND